MEHHEIEGSETGVKREVPTLTTKIGGITYMVGVHFSKTSRETLQDKMKRMEAEEGSSGKLRTDITTQQLLNGYPIFFIFLKTIGFLLRYII